MPEDTFCLKPKHIYLLHRLSFVNEDGRADYIRNNINDYSDPSDRMLSEGESTENGRPLKYAQEFIERFIRLYKILLAEPDTLVKVVDGFDSVCSLECNRRADSCGSSAKYWKEFVYNSFGLGADDTFAVSKIARA